MQEDKDFLSEFAHDIIQVATEEGLDLTFVVNEKPAAAEGKERKYMYGMIPLEVQKSLHRRQEAPLVEDPTSTEATAAPTSAASPSATNVAAFPLTPECYESSESCMDETNSCSGHGKCVLTRKAPPADNEKDPIECYQCKCSPQVEKNDRGQSKTTYYGGSACHKVDISAPFWLLTLTAGSLLALVGFGVSMLYTMGNAELPSVIGAGVSGPRPK